ncbi:MAG: LysE family transporter [Massilia sp.]|nr:LysE family transporter [Massilia sp.]
MAIGAQNAHVLRTGLRREHVGITVLLCIVIDVALIAAGVAGMGAMVQASPLLLALARWGGAAFLLWYGLRSWRAVFAAGSLAVSAQQKRTTTRQAVLSILALSLLNPHVYLDTVVLLGAIGGGFAAAERPAFALGAMTASALWFGGLGYGATRLSGWLARPVAWKCIDALTGATMLALAASVALSKP